jgi:hypothetical protein
MGFVFLTYVYIMKNCKHLHRLHKLKIYIPKMFLACVPKIFNFLSLSVKLQHYNYIFIFDLSIIVTKV